MPARTIHVKPGSELDRLLDYAAETPIELEKSGVRYRLNRVDPSSEPDEQSPEEPIHDSILNIVGIGASEEITDVAQHKRAYIAEALDSADRP